MYGPDDSKPLAVPSAETANPLHNYQGSSTVSVLVQPASTDPQNDGTQFVSYAPPAADMATHSNPDAVPTAPQGNGRRMLSIARPAGGLNVDPKPDSRPVLKVPMVKSSSSDSDDSLDKGKRFHSDFSASMYIAETTHNVRNAFIRKVYAVLTVQLLITAGFCAGFMYIDGAQEYVITHTGIMWTAIILSFVCIFAMFIFRKRHPWNIVLLLAFTICESWMVGTVVTFYDTQTVIQAFAVTMSVFFGLTTYAFVSKKDFSFMLGGLSACLWILIMGLFLGFFWPLGSTTEIVLSYAGAIIFSLFILVDTSLLIHKYSADEWVMAAVNLYLDIINLFLYILRILGKK